MSEFVVLGEVLIDAFTPTGVALHAARELHPRPGGAPANVAVGLARLGAPVAFVGKVGADDYGFHLRDLLAAEGVDVTGVAADRRGATMLALIALVSATEQQVVVYPGATAFLEVGDLPRARLEQARIFIYNSVTLGTASRNAAWQAAEWARAGGATVLFDVNLRPFLWPDLDAARLLFERSVAGATVLKLNDTELEYLTGTRDPAAGASNLLARGPSLVCVTLGAGGAYFATARACGRVPAFAVQVVDATGSGDAFVAGLAYRLARHAVPLGDLDAAALHAAVRFANACGALAATQLGAMAALPTLAAAGALAGSGRDG
jgi:fructokinase